MHVFDNGSYDRRDPRWREDWARTSAALAFAATANIVVITEMTTTAAANVARNITVVIECIGLIMIRYANQKHYVSGLSE
jgi:hypothetical protein